MTIRHWLTPQELLGSGGHVSAVNFARGGPAGGGAERLAADMVFKAIGQRLDDGVLAGAGLTLAGSRIQADADGRTGVVGVWAGGDARAGGRDLTVEAVEDGKRAALSIHARLAA